MPLDNAQNGSRGILAAGITSAASTLTLSPGQGVRMPTVPFNAWLYNATDYSSDPHDDPGYEIVRVTARSTDTLTITRAQEGTSASDHNTPGKAYRLVAGLTAKTINADLSQNGSYRLEAFNASGSIATTTGSITAGQPTLTVASASTFAAGQGIFIAGAGASGAALVTTISSIAGTTLTLATNASTTVSSALVQHDDTTAIQTALNTVVNAGGGRIQFSPGVYRVNGPFQATNSILRVPYIPITGGSPIPIMLEAVAPPPWFSFDGPISNAGVIIQSDKIGVDNNSVIFAAATWVPGTEWNVFTNVVIYIEGIQFRTYDNPQIGGLDLGMAGGAQINNIFIDTGIRLQDGAEPLYDRFALRMPRANTPTGYMHSSYVYVMNYAQGCIVAEANGYQGFCPLRCKVGIRMDHNFHPIIFYIGAWQCPTVLSILGQSIVDLNLSIENAPDGFWYSPISGHHVYDATDALHGVIRYSSIRSGTGDVVPLSNTGATAVAFTNLRA